MFCGQIITNLNQLLLILFLLFPLFGWSQPALFSGARQIGNEAANMAVEDVWSTVLNPAGIISHQNQVAWGVENRFGLRELNLLAISGIYHRPTNSWGAHFQQFGLEGYQTQTAALCFAKPLGPVRVGLRFRGWWVQQGFWGASSQQLQADLGLQYRIKKWELGIAANQALRWSSTDFPAQWQTAWSLRYQMRQAFLCLGVALLAQHQTSFGAALHFDVQPKFQARVGVGQNPAGLSLGCTYRLKNFQCDLSFAWQQRLGITSATSMDYAW